MSEATPSTPLSAQTPPRAWWRRRWVRRTGWFLLMLVIVWQLAPMLAEPYLRRRLQTQLSGQFSAKLELGRLSYSFPYGLKVRDARLVATDPAVGPVEILKIARLDVDLARLPIGKGPLVIRSITLHQPELHLVRTADGLIGQKPRRRPASTPPATTLAASSRPATGSTSRSASRATSRRARPAPKNAKPLSAMFELRHFTIDDGSVVFEDRRRPQNPPLVWRSIRADIAVEPHDKSRYGFRITAANQAIAALDGEGEFDLDALELSAKSLRLTAICDPNRRESPLPPALWQQVIDRHIRGQLTLTAQAFVPLKKLDDCVYDATLKLTSASGRLPGMTGDLDSLSFDIRCTNDPAKVAARFTRPPEWKGRSLYVAVDALDAALADHRLAMRDSLAFFDQGLRQWRLYGLHTTVTAGSNYAAFGPELQRQLRRFEPRGQVEISASGTGPLDVREQALAGQDFSIEVRPRGLRFLVPNWPLPISDITGGAVRITPTQAQASNLHGFYGQDQVDLTSGQLEFSRMKSQIRFHDVHVGVTIAGGQQPYPRWLQAVVNQVHPKGVFRVSGSHLVDRSDKSPSTYYDLLIATDHAQMEVGAHRIPLADVSGDCRVTPELAEIVRDERDGRRQVRASLFGGAVDLAVHAHLLSGMLDSYDGALDVRDVDVRQFAQAWLEKDRVSQTMSGKASGGMTFLGRHPRQGQKPIDAFAADGDIDVADGDFWHAPVVASVLGQLPTVKGALTAGEAAARFTVADGRISLDPAALSSPLLGLQGTGTIGLDKSIDLRIVVAPLSDWRDGLRKSRIPLLDSIGAEVAGGLQRVINVAQGLLLYEFRVTGTLSKHDVRAVAVPILNDAAAAIFGDMLGGKNLHERIHRPTPATQKQEK